MSSLNFFLSVLGIDLQLDLDRSELLFDLIQFTLGLSAKPVGVGSDLDRYAPNLNATGHVITYFLPYLADILPNREATVILPLVFSSFLGRGYVSGFGGFFFQLPVATVLTWSESNIPARMSRSEPQPKYSIPPRASACVIESLGKPRTSS